MASSVDGSSTSKINVDVNVDDDENENDDVNRANDWVP